MKRLPIQNLLTKHSVLFMLSAGAIFVSGSYVLEGLATGSGFHAFEYSGKGASDSSVVIRSVGALPDDDYLIGPDTDRSIKFFSASAALFTPCILTGSYSGHADVPVNSFEYDSALGFSPLRSPPSYS